MSRSYNLNPEQAKQADNVGNRITETGKYIGTFTKAESIKSKSQTEGIEFAFQSVNGQSADFLTIWTYNNEGKEIFGLKQLNAIMTCLKVKTITPTDGLVEKWEGGAKAKVPATIYPELMGKKIGVLLQREEYFKADGSTGNKFNIYACFDAESEMVASEILERATVAAKLPKILATLKDRPAQVRNNAPTGAAPSKTGGTFDELDDDIPF